MIITLVRHGESEANKLRIIQGHKDYPLSDLGREQARNLAEYFSENNYVFDKVYSSDLIRAKETAETLSSKLGITEINFDSRLREFNLGIYQGRHNDDMTSEDNAFLQSCWADHSKRVPEGETVEEMKNRIKEAFYEIVEQNEGAKRILIVGHGGSLYHILHYTLGIFKETYEWFENCKINEAVRDGNTNTWKYTIHNGKKLTE